MENNIQHFEVSPEKSEFKMIFADLTHRCNMKCANCYLPNRTVPDMDVEKLYSTLKRLPKSADIRLIGAEPTLRDDLFEIIEKVLQLGHRASLVTNGLKLADYNYCKELKKTGLRVVNISMNGADDDSLYRKVDGGSYARLKVQALENTLKLGFRVGTGTIISNNLNEPAISRIVQIIVEIAKRNSLSFPYRGYAPLVRFKNIGALGRYQEDGLMTVDQLMEKVCAQLDIPEDELRKNVSARGTIYIRPLETAAQQGYQFSEDPRSFYWEMKTEVGSIMILINDWDSTKSGIPDQGNLNRGRFTQNWTVAPFFEDVKLNEFGF